MNVSMILGCSCINKTAKKRILEGLNMVNTKELVGEPLILARQPESEFLGVSNNAKELLEDAKYGIKNSRNCTSDLELFFTGKKETGLGKCTCLSNISKDLMKRGIDKVLIKEKNEKKIGALLSLNSDIQKLPDCAEELRTR